MALEADKLVLPVSVVGPGDLGHLIRELETVDQALMQAKLRKAGDETSVPRLSRLLNELVEANTLNLLHEDEREELAAALSHLHEKAPAFHMSFNAEPSAAFLQKLMVWLRKEIHPQVLVRLGLEPSIGAGCIVRTANHVFDFSLREHFVKSRYLLSEGLRAAEETSDGQQ